MRHSVYGRKLSRTTDARKRLLTVLVRDLFTHGTMVTTLAKAKAVQPLVEKVITKAKHAKNNEKTQLESLFGDSKLAKMVFEDVHSRFASRTSGYTRITKIGTRRGDASEMVQFAFVDQKVEAEVVKPVSGKETKKEPAAKAKKTEPKKVKPAVKKKTVKTTSKK